MSRKINRWISLVLALTSAISSFAQNQAIGTWTVYMPYTVSKSMCDAGNKIYNAAAQTIFSFNKNTAEIQTYDKSNGLNDVGIQTIDYDPATNFLVIAYVDNNIDLIYNGTDIYNFPDLQTEGATQTIIINSISFYNGSAYFSTNLGIVVVDLSQMLISDTYVIGSSGSPVNVSSTTFDSINIYAATSEGLKYAPLNSTDLDDYNNWSLFPGLPVKAASWVTEYNNNLYAVLAVAGGDTIYAYNGAGWNKVFNNNYDSIVGINLDNNSLYFSIWNDSAGNQNGLLGKETSNGQFILSSSPGPRPINWFESYGSTWYADFYNGMYVNTNGDLRQIAPAGPFTNNVFRMCAHNGVLDVAPGGIDDSWDPDYNRDGFFIYQNDKWLYRNQYTDALLANFTDFLCTAYVPSTGNTYFGSYFYGLIEYYPGGHLTLYNKYNSILEGAIGDSGRTKISCLTVDGNNNLWIGNAGAPSLIKVFRPSDSTWISIEIPYTILQIKQMLIDENNQVWALCRNNNGVMVFSYGADITNPSDYSSVFLSTAQGSGGLPSSNVYSIAEDSDGNVWVGTDQGIGIFYCAADVLQPGGCDAEQIKVVGADGYVAYLFATETVRAIVVDAANRKWIGTDNGAWLISADGQTQLLNFNSSNSPMPANQVTDIQIDNTTGIVYIGTIAGLVSYQGDAVAVCQDCNQALVYPNPVKPGYDGPIAIKGLASNANVKITDVTGTLVYQGTANGEQMIWSGYNYNGVRAKSGVYMVYSADNEGQERKVAKILIMN